MSEPTFKDVVRILKLIDGAPGADIDLQTAEFSLKIKRGDSRIMRKVAEPDKTEATNVTASAPQATAAIDEGAGTPVTAPMAGMFYAAPAPGQPPFARIGETVQMGDQLGLIEVMKLFTPIAAPVSGTITSIRVDDQQAVTKDEVLMRIEEEA